MRNSPIRNSKISVLAVICLVIAGCFAFDRQNEQFQLQLETERVRAQADALGRILETALNAPIQSSFGLIATLETEPDMQQSRYAELVRKTFSPNLGIRNVAAARDLVVSLIYPVEGNEATLGLDYRLNKDQREDVQVVQQSGEFRLFGPVDLVQGGQGFIARFPIFDRSDARPTFWGILSVVIDAPVLYQRAGLGDSDLELEVGLIDPSTGPQPRPFFGTPGSLSSNPVAIDILFPNGRWNLMAKPIGGWGSTVSLARFRTILAIFGTLIIFPTVLAHQFLVAKNTSIERLEKKQTELMIAHQALKKISLQDELTELPNRRHMKIELSELSLRRQSGFILIDLERFHDINLNYGQQVGDTLLRQVANRLRDAAGPEHFVARISGDEFAILCRYDSSDRNNATDEQTKRRTQQILDRVFESLRTPIWAAGHKHRISISAGVEMVCQRFGRTADDILNRANDALSVAKSNGRNRFHFAPSVNVPPQQAQITGDSLIEAFSEHQIIAHYQPQFDASGKKLIGLEALARWNHPILGLCLPGQFLDIAELHKLESELDYAVMASIAVDIENWRSAGHYVPLIGVNLSARTLCDAALMDHLARLRLGSTEIKIELLESIELDDFSQAMGANVAALKQKSYRIEIDDFGTGYSSITSLLRIEPSCLKIDRSVVEAATDGRGSENLLSLIVEMGHALGTEVCAEGIGAAANLVAAQNAKCDMLQGFLLGKPTNAKATALLLNDEVYEANKAS